MNRRLLISVFCLVLVLIVRPSFGDPSPVCISDSGISLCVQFDNLPNAPVEFTDFAVSFDSSHVPSIELLRGSVPNGTQRQWRIWSKDAQGNPANIGEIKGITAYDFDVKILDDTGGPGASIVQGIDLQPADESSVIHHSNITGGNIATLAGELARRESTIFAERDRRLEAARERRRLAREAQRVKAVA